MRATDLDDKHFGEELDLRAEEMACVRGGAVRLDPDTHMDVRGHLLSGRILGEGAAAERLDTRKMNRIPDRGVRVIDRVAGADDLNPPEPGDEARYVPLPHVVFLAEVGQRGKEVIAVVDGDRKAAAQGEFVTTHGPLPDRSGPWLGPTAGTRQVRRRSGGWRRGRVRLPADGEAGRVP